jgi:N-6 DNA Methylase
VPASSESLAILQHLAGKPGHDEVKAGFRQSLIAEFDVPVADVRFEQRVEVKSRIDALIGRTVFEAKRDLASEMEDVERKMPDYLANREAIKETTLDPNRPDEFLAWLDGALALKISLPPDPQTVRIELGADSVAFRAADSALRLLWARLKQQPSVALKHQLWGQLLKIVYGRDVDNEALWLQHTYLLVVAKCVALAVLGMNEDDPQRLLSGEALAGAGIAGAVESDFFDWVVADPEGAKLVRRIMAHVRRFRLAEVESDVMKVLYESLIDRSERHGLGEYYTPDWLAAKIVRHAVDRPLEQRVLDPACGSGTFLFHALRRLLARGGGQRGGARRAGHRGVAACRGNGYPSDGRHHRARHLPARARPCVGRAQGAANHCGLSRRRIAAFRFAALQRKAPDDPRAPQRRFAAGAARFPRIAVPRSGSF